MTNLELDPVEQKALLDEVTDIVLRSAPQDWSRLAVEYKAVGRHAVSYTHLTLPTNREV